MTHSGDARILRRLSSGDTDPILVADFQAMSMSPRLSDMLSERIQGRPVFQIDPIGVLSGERRYVPLPELAGACADEFQEAGAQHGRAIVVGHCSAAPLALHVADLLAHERPVTAVLVNPTWPGNEHVTVKFDEFLAKFGPAARPAPDLNDDPELVVAAMAQILLDEVTALAASRGVSSSAGAFSDLIVWYRAWLAFLLAGRNDRQIRHTAGQAAVTVLSDSPSQVTVPGRDEHTFLVRELPPQPVGTVTPELAEIVAERVATNQSSIA
ncbi:alpha/beta fold hydrolase [Micromonospora sp. NPDC005298]|uniref:alpha/beta fold hydrolase n=1 Tax=Micromonospora sp. NPDC005298 TaxID=3156873 RepID=UPI0033B0AF77